MFNAFDNLALGRLDCAIRANGVRLVARGGNTLYVAIEPADDAIGPDSRARQPIFRALALEVVCACHFRENLESRSYVVLGTWPERHQEARFCPPNRSRKTMGYAHIKLNELTLAFQLTILYFVPPPP